MAAIGGDHDGGPHNSQEQHQNIISHAAEKFHLKKPARVVAEKTVRAQTSQLLWTDHVDTLYPV